MASTWLGKKLLALNIRCKTMAPTTAVIKVVHIRKVSRYFKEVLGWNSNMKLQLILVLFHMNRLHPYMNKCKLSNAKTLHKNSHP